MTRVRLPSPALCCRFRCRAPHCLPVSITVNVLLLPAEFSRMIARCLFWEPVQERQHLLHNQGEQTGPAPVHGTAACSRCAGFSRQSIPAAVSIPHVLLQLLWPMVKHSSVDRCRAAHGLAVHAVAGRNRLVFSSGASFQLSARRAASG